MPEPAPSRPAEPRPSDRQAPGVLACLGLAAGAALAGLLLRLALPPSAPAGGPEGAQRRYEVMRQGMAPAMARRVDEIWRRLGPPN